MADELEGSKWKSVQMDSTTSRFRYPSGIPKAIVKCVYKIDTGEVLESEAKATKISKLFDRIGISLCHL